MLLELTGDEMALGYLDFLFENITAEVYHLETVEECRLNGAEGVGSGYEEDVREVVVQFEVVVVKSFVLLGVEYFEQCRGGVAVVAHALHLVDFVEDEDRVAHPGFLDALDDAAGHGADVGLAMPADFGLVVKTAQGNTDIFPVHGLGDALA